MNVQFLALAYTHIHLAAYSCKVLFTLAALKSPNCSVSRVTAASVAAAAGLTTSRCYAHRARHLTLVKPMCIDSRHVCAEATEDSTLVTFAAARIYSSPCRPLLRTPPPPPHPPTKNISPVLHELHSGPWESGEAVAPFAPYWLRHCLE